jgi:hypothetical protein
MERTVPVSKDKDNREIKQSGRCVGVEVEHSPFKGMMTLFIARYSCLSKPIPHDVTRIEHIYVGISANAGFWDRSKNWGRLRDQIVDRINEGYRVTLDVPPDPAILGLFTGLRVSYSERFCLMITVVVPMPDFGGFCLKAEPKRLFSSAGYGEGGVYVARHADMKCTLWSEYVGDEAID